MEKRILPDFKSEAQEAKWWFDNQNELDKDWLGPPPKAACIAAAPSFPPRPRI